MRKGYFSALAATTVVLPVLLSSCGGGGYQPAKVQAAAPLTSSVTISQPANGATVGSPLRVVMSARSATPVAGIKILADGKSVYESATGQIDTQITLPVGKHNITGEAWDSSQRSYQSTVQVNVKSSSSDPATLGPPNASRFTHIEEIGGWDSCTVCAGINARGPVALYSMTEGVSSPSMDGNSAHFWLGGHTPYSAAIWDKQLGGNNNLHHFLYDLYFYVKDPGASQALEFDVNQSTDNLKYIFGTQCDYKGRGHQWDVWDTAGKKWIPTGVPCPVPGANTWHHLTWEFERTSDQRAHFVSMTFDGVAHPINMYFKPKPMNVFEVNVAFQMDGDYAQHNYDVWLDNVSLIAW